VFSVGDDVYVKVLKADTESGKMSLSIRHVDQKTGFDLDPNDIHSSWESKKPTSKPEHTPIQIQAILNVTCPKCGGVGHLVC